MTFGPVEPFGRGRRTWFHEYVNGPIQRERIDMFVETITAPSDVWRHWTDQLRLLSDPPPALFASIAWDNGDGTVSGVNIWDGPSAVADFFLERVQPIVAAEGAPDYKPVRRGEPVGSYFRQVDSGGQ